MLLPLIALVAAAQVPPRDAAALTAEDQVRDICAALKEQGGEPAPGVSQPRSRAQALSQTRQVLVPANGFGLGRYREAEQELELDGDRALRALDGALTLDLAGVDDVAFRASAAELKQWTAAKKAGKLTLTVYFRPSLLDTEMPRPDAGKDRLAAVQGALDRCAQAARRRGSLVVSFGVQDGHVRNPQVIMDAARDEDTARCVSQALSGATISGADPAASRGTASLATQ